MQTILITGTSSGYGLETARHFLANGWSVIATMRKPDRTLLPDHERLQILPLDVTCAQSIAAAIHAAGPIDVLVNNAGIGAAGAFEATPMTHIRALFDTNFFGTLSLCQAVIPQMRARRSGVIVNVTSTVTYAAMPLTAAYTASKHAIDGFTSALAHEVGHFGIRVKLVAPGYGPTTRFAQNTDFNAEQLIPPAYATFAGPIFDAFASPAMTTKESDVAEAIWLAVHDDSNRLHYPAGEDAVALYTSRFG